MSLYVFTGAVHIGAALVLFQYLFYLLQTCLWQYLFQVFKDMYGSFAFFADCFQSRHKLLKNLYNLNAQDSPERFILSDFAIFLVFTVWLIGNRSLDYFSPMQERDNSYGR